MKSPLWQCIDQHYDKFERTYSNTHQENHGALRPVVSEVVQKFLACGDLRSGFTRIRCDQGHEYLRPLSCKCRGFCPSCHQKKVLTTAQFIVREIVAPVPHRLYTLTMPKMLRTIFSRNRQLLGSLYPLAQESLKEYLHIATSCSEGMSGMILVLHTAGEYLNFNPHVHALVADGLFIFQPSQATVAGSAATSASEKRPKVSFFPRSQTSLDSL